MRKQVLAGADLVCCCEYVVVVLLNSQHFSCRFGQKRRNLLASYFNSSTVGRVHLKHQNQYRYKQQHQHRHHYQPHHDGCCSFIPSFALFTTKACEQQQQPHL